MSNDDREPELTVPGAASGTCVHRGVSPPDPASGEYHELRIYAENTPNGFEIYKQDEGHWPVDDLYEIYRVAPEELPKLRRVLGGVGDEDLAQLIAQRINDGTIPVPGAHGHWTDVMYFPAGWFRDHEIGYRSASERLPN